MWRVMGACIPCLFFLLLLLAGSCVSGSAPVGSVRVDSTRSTLLLRDSIVLHDSIYIVERGDTVFRTEYKYCYRDRVHCDTFCSVQCDTVVRIVEVERSLTFWQHRKLELAEVVLWLLPLLALFLFIKRRFF